MISAAGLLSLDKEGTVLITGGSNPEYAQWVFEGQGVDAQKLQLDYAARDTLSNFTTLVDRLRRRGIRHVLLVTSSDHMDRALLVGRVVAGSRGIHLTPVPVPCGDDCRPERRSKHDLVLRVDESFAELTQPALLGGGDAPRPRAGSRL